MNEFLELISHLIVPLIFIFAVLAFICACIAIRGIKKEEKKLAKCRGNLNSFEANDKFELRKNRLCEQIDQISENHKEARIGQGKLLQLRLETIRDALTTKNVKVMPSLHDLHSLSTQDEMSRISSCCFRTILSFMLIMGILGTLSGVHTVVGNGGVIDIRGLGKALEPSMLAVFATVLLMWVRGYYVSKFDGYLEELDLFTMADLLPFLQPITEMHNQTVSLQENLDDLSKKADEFGIINSRMSELKDGICEYIKKAEKGEKDICLFREELDKVGEEIKFANEKEIECEFVLKVIPKEGRELLTSFTRCISQLRKYEESLNERCYAVSEQYNQMVNNIDTIVHDLDKVRQGVNTMDQKVKSMDEIGKIICEYESELTDISNEMIKVQDVFEIAENLKKEMVVAQNLVVDSSAEAKAMLVEAKSLVQEIGNINSEFHQSIEVKKEMLESDVINFNKKMKAFDKTKQEFVGELKVLSKRMAL